MHDYSNFNSGKIDLKNAGSKKEKKKTKIVLILIFAIFTPMIIFSFFFGDS